MDRDEFGAIVEPSSDEEDFGFEEADDGNLVSSAFFLLLCFLPGRRGVSRSWPTSTFGDSSSCVC